MKWNEVAPDARPHHLTSLTRKMTVLDALTLLASASTGPMVLIGKSVTAQIEEHLVQKKVELGGLLTGRVYGREDNESGAFVVSVHDAVPSDSFDSTGVSLSMDSNVWQKANTSLTSGDVVVGWYHSHPNLGAFFSGTDRRTQAAFFSNFYSLGLVVDPFRDERKWFLGGSCVELEETSILEIERPGITSL